MRPGNTCSGLGDSCIEVLHTSSEHACFPLHYSTAARNLWAEICGGLVQQFCQNTWRWGFDEFVVWIHSSFSLASVPYVSLEIFSPCQKMFLWGPLSGHVTESCPLISWNFAVSARHSRYAAPTSIGQSYTLRLCEGTWAACFSADLWSPVCCFYGLGLFVKLFIALPFCPPEFTH